VRFLFCCRLTLWGELVTRLSSIFGSGVFGDCETFGCDAAMPRKAAWHQNHRAQTFHVALDGSTLRHSGHRGVMNPQRLACVRAFRYLQIPGSALRVARD
jgi:hypothetical protein